MNKEKRRDRLYKRAQEGPLTPFDWSEFHQIAEPYAQINPRTPARTDKLADRTVYTNGKSTTPRQGAL